MTKENRIRRAVRRGERNPATFTARNLKANREYDRWFKSLLITKHVESNGFVWWTVAPTSGLIHKGRKP